eukprot:s2201_g6.t1
MKLAMDRAASVQHVVSEPSVWVVDGAVSESFLKAVDGKFACSECGSYLTETRNGKAISSRSMEFPMDDQSRELFETVAGFWGLNLEQSRDKFTVSDICGEGQSPHIDHINLEDLADYNLDFLDLDCQSSAKQKPRRVVPTISVVVYFNAVGGICFPHAPDELGTIAAERGRIVMFENYNDSQRPDHDALAAHYGLYFDSLPKRILVMGILANETPTFSADGARSKIPLPSLIYCPATEHDPLRHDNPSYWSTAELEEMEEQRRREAEQDKLKTDLILPLEVLVDHSGEKESLVVTGRNLAGEELCTIRGDLEEKVSWLRWEIKKMVDPEDKHHVVLMRPSGRLIALDQNSLLLRDLRPGCLADVKAAFAKADLNKDGFLDKSEVKEMLKALAKDLPIMSDGEIDRLFDAVDANADGRLNVTEFIDWCFGVKSMDDAEHSDLKGQLARAKASLVKGLPPAKITRTGSS